MSLPLGELGPSVPVNRYNVPRVVGGNKSGATYLADRNRFSVPRPPPRRVPNRWTQQGYEISRPYSGTSRQGYNETSFTERVSGSQDQNLSSIGEGIRQRRPVQQQEGSDSVRDRIPESTPERGTSDTRIDIPESSERVPLLQSAGTAAAAGSGAGLSGLQTGFAGALGVAGGGILGAALTQLKSRADEKGYVLPDSEYIGPGNPIPIGAAKNPTEQIARDHDLGYGEVLQKAYGKKWTFDKFNREIRKLDDVAWGKFWERYGDEGDWKALVGYLGLRAKAAVEKHTGVIYPSFTGKLCRIVL